jgi:hypothetical protein
MNTKVPFFTKENIAQLELIALQCAKCTTKGISNQLNDIKSAALASMIKIINDKDYAKKDTLTESEWSYVKGWARAGAQQEAHYMGRNAILPVKRPIGEFDEFTSVSEVENEDGKTSIFDLLKSEGKEDYAYIYEAIEFIECKKEQKVLLTYLQKEEISNYYLFKKALNSLKKFL